MPEKHAAGRKAETTKPKQDVQREVTHLRSLAHDLSNSLEAIMQASYLLAQSKLQGESKRWAELLEASANEAAKINREMRKLLRTMSDE